MKRPQWPRLPAEISRGEATGVRGVVIRGWQEKEARGRCEGEVLHILREGKGETFRYVRREDRMRNCLQSSVGGGGGVIQEQSRG